MAITALVANKNPIFLMDSPFFYVTIAPCLFGLTGVIFADVIGDRFW
jgi:hypothetical protein